MGDRLAALKEARMALAKAIGLLEAHWEVCANPFPDATLRRTLDRIDAAIDHAANGSQEQRR